MVEANNNGKNDRITTTHLDDKMIGGVEESKEPIGSSNGDLAATDSHVLQQDDDPLVMLDAHRNMRELTNLELIQKAEDCVDKLKLEKAVSLYDEGIRRYPNDTLIMD